MLKKLSISLILVLLISIAGAFFPVPAQADGGPIVPRDLWDNLKEGQQVAVVTILNNNSAKIDLFISIQDKTNQSHEIVFFVPVGTNTSNFYAVEQDLATFDREKTTNLDRIIRDTALDKQHALQVLFSGALLTNGALLVPIWAPVLLTGCSAPATKPEATYETESSEISIYGIDEDTDLNELINTTGLPPSVFETLSKLKGQKVAVVKLQTKPQTGGSTRPGGYGYSEPGLHLSWNASLVSSEKGPTYSYPLGTGGAWSKPIELTRVYVVAPTGWDFDVTYPAIGSNQSGFDLIEGARITKYYQIPAYSIDDATGDFGRVWRATYTQSNPTEDIVIVAKPQSSFSKFQAGAQQSALSLSFAFAFLIGLLIWLLAWHFLMPRFIGKDAREQGRLRWYWGLIYPGINAAFILFPGSLLYVLFLFGLTAPSLIVTFLILGGASIGFYALIHSGRLGVSRGKAIRAYILTSLISSAGYLVLAVGFAKLVGII